MEFDILHFKKGRIFFSSASGCECQISSLTPQQPTSGCECQISSLTPQQPFKVQQTSWVFDNIMLLARKHVNEELTNLRSLMDEAENPLRFIYLADLSSAERAALTHALESAYTEAKEAGSESFDDPDFYPGFLDRFGELLDLITKSA